MKWWAEKAERTVMHRFINKDIWGEVRVPSWYTDSIYVQNDEYAKFRMAEADGKIIEYHIHSGDGKEWVDVTNSSDLWCSGLEYRIKPSEPRFKAGDYVVRLNNNSWIIRLEAEHLPAYNNEDGYQPLGNEVRLWTLEDAADDEWIGLPWFECETFTVLQKSNIGETTQVQNAIPYIGQTIEELGLSIIKQKDKE